MRNRLIYLIYLCMMIWLQQLTEILQSSTATTAAQFDSELLAVLGSDAFLSDMESSRNEVIEYVQNKKNEES